MKRSNIIILIFISISLWACKVTKPYQSPAMPESNRYRNSGIDTASIADIPWQQLFSDTILQRLIQQALDNNNDLKVAVARIKSAEANFRQSKSAFFPSITADAEYTLSKPSAAQIRATNPSATASLPTINQYTLTGGASWEADIWGKLRSTKKAAFAALLASDAYKRAIQTEIVAAVANNYYALMALDKQLSIARQTIEIRRTDTGTVKLLKDAAKLTGADVMQSHANLYAAEVQAEMIKKSIWETENAISVLLGAMPQSIPRSTFDAQIVSADLRTGIPLQLLSNRPDVQQAEFNFRNAFELTNVARTYFYPTLSISANGGFATVNTLKGFFDGSFYGSLISGLSQPIFNKGLNKQRLQQAQATQEEALYSFKATVLTASQEVADALFSYQNAADVNASRTKQIGSLTKAVEYTKELMRFTSNVNYTDVLTAETNLLSAQLNNINDKLQQLQAVVNLYRALGGGWK